MPRPQPDQLATLVRQRATEPPPAGDIYSIASGFVGHHTAHKKRISRMDAVVDGRWATVWPDGTVTDDLPKVADMITSDMEDLTALIAGPDPTVIVPPDSDRDKDVKSATKRQQILATYRATNEMDVLRERLAMDLVGTGLCCLIVWPDYNTLYPRYIRRDPRNVYPDPSLTSEGEVGSVVVSYRTKARLLARAYPNANIAGEMYTTSEQKEWENRDVEVVEYYDKDWCMKIAATPAKGRRSARAIVLASVPNLVGQPLALIQSRTTFDGQFRGQFDKSIDPLGTANKMMEMKLAQLADEIYAEKIIRGVFDNPDDFGPGATMFTTDYQASIGRAETARASADFYNDINLLLSQARESGGVPAARHGQIEQSIASAQFVNAVQGKYITSVANYQKRMARLERRLNAVALAVDENYLDYTDKGLAGTMGGRSFTGSYTPSVDIAGKYETRVVYGAGSGMDAYNRRLAVIQDKQYNLVSARTARSQLDYVEDVIAEEAEIAREQMEAGFIAGLSDPATPLDVRTRALALLSAGNSVSAVAEIMYEDTQAQAAQQVAVQQALAPATPAPGGGGGAPYIPPLPALRGA